MRHFFWPVVQLKDKLQRSVVELLQKGDIMGAFFEHFRYELCTALDVDPDDWGPFNLKKVLTRPNSLKEFAQRSGYDFPRCNVDEFLQTVSIRWLLVVPRCDDMLDAMCNASRSSQQSLSESELKKAWIQWVNQLADFGVAVCLGATLKVGDMSTAGLGETSDDSLYSGFKQVAVQPLVEPAMRQIVGRKFTLSVHNRPVLAAVKEYLEKEQIMLQQRLAGLAAAAVAFAKHLNKGFSSYNLNKIQEIDDKTVKQVVDRALEATQDEFKKHISEFEEVAQTMAQEYENRRQEQAMLARRRALEAAVVEGNAGVEDLETDDNPEGLVVPAEDHNTEEGQ